MTALALAVFVPARNSAVAQNKEVKTNESVLFKIHDIAPEKDVNGNVTHCNISITFFNRYSKALSNSQINLTWDDEVIDDIIDQEDMNAREALRRNPKAVQMRYTTAKTTHPTLSTTIKLPLINAHQQISLKNKVMTDRCFLLINDMEVKVMSCAFADEKASSRGCTANFQYVSPKDPQYFSEFKEISYEEAVNIEQVQADQLQNETNAIYDDVVSTLRKIGD